MASRFIACFALAAACLAAFAFTPAPAAAETPQCTQFLSGGSALEYNANRSASQVLCLRSAYYYEALDPLIVITQPNVRIQAASGEHPVVCGHIVPRGNGSSVASDVQEDPHCAVYFNEASPYNQAASSYGPPVTIPGTWLADFDGTGTGSLLLSRKWDHGKAIYRASASDPVTAKFRIADSSQCFNDPNGCRGWQPDDPDQVVPDETSTTPDLIPIPAGVRCAGLPTVDDAHDRALVVISADGRTAWEFWHCTHVATPSEPHYTAGVAAKWALDPNGHSPANRGYQDFGLTATGTNSARASGTPLVSTTVTPREALWGINHAIGLTVQQVDNGYVAPPASHTDGCAACGHLRYGMLFVLDPSFPIRAGPTPGQINFILALKKYGAYIVDKGPQFELDGSPNDPLAPSQSDQEWSDAAVLLAQLAIRPSDLRYVRTPGSPPPIP